MNDTEKMLQERRLKYRGYWYEKSEWYWLKRLLEEVWELIGTMVGWHKHSTDLELSQISTITANWLEMRENR